MKYDFNDYNVEMLFASPVYRISRPDFLPILKSVFNEYINETKASEPKNELYPSTITRDMKLDNRLNPFLSYFANISWDVLNTQGYFMDPFLTQIASVWGQSHSKYSSMEYHTHGDGLLCGFYFLDTPENSMGMVLHDPRPGKTITGLPIKNNDTSLSINSIGFFPKPGDLIITNGWLPHAFSRNGSDKDYNFLHITTNVIYDPNYQALGNNSPIVV